MLSGFIARAIGEITRGEALAAFHLKVFEAEPSFLTARNEIIAAALYDTAGCGNIVRTKTKWHESRIGAWNCCRGASPNMASSPSKMAICAGPGLEAPNAVINLTCGKVPGDLAVLFL